MTDFFAIPTDQLDAAAREAFRGYVARLGGCSEVGRRHSIDQRTIERIFAGERDVPPGLASEIAEAERIAADAIAARAAALQAWANSRQQGSHANG